MTIKEQRITERQNSTPSTGEQDIITILKKHKIKYEREKHFDDLLNSRTGANLFYDFYLPDIKAVIEFDGIHHFKNSNKSLLASQLHRDTIKDKYCIKNNISILRIKCFDSKQSERLVIQFIEKVKASPDKAVIAIDRYVSSACLKGFKTVKQFNILSEAGFMMITSKLIQSVGLQSAVLLSYLIRLHHFKNRKGLLEIDGSFTYSKKTVAEKLLIKIAAQKPLIKILKDAKLISFEKELMEFPVKLNFYKIKENLLP